MEVVRFRSAGFTALEHKDLFETYWTEVHFTDKEKSMIHFFFEDRGVVDNGHIITLGFINFPEVGEYQFCSEFGFPVEFKCVKFRNRLSLLLLQNRADFKRRGESCL